MPIELTEYGFDTRVRVTPHGQCSAKNYNNVNERVKVVNADKTSGLN